MVDSNNKKTKIIKNINFNNIFISIKRLPHLLTPLKRILKTGYKFVITLIMILQVVILY